MNPKLESQLETNYPFMRKKEQRRLDYIDDLYSAYGCQCEDGWYDLIDQLCAAIVHLHEQAGLKADIEILQIKEKFGVLRFYYSLPGQSADLLGPAISDLVLQAQQQSERTCEVCGKPGKLRTAKKSWQTLCEDCCQER